MFKLNLVLRRKTDDKMLFSPAPWFRILFLAIAAFIIVGIITIKADEPGERGFLIPVIIASVCIIAGLYEESWIFDRNKGIITSKTGMAFVFRRREYAFDEIENLEIFTFLRNSNPDLSGVQPVEIKNVFLNERTTESISSRANKGLRKYHQELRINLKSGKNILIECHDTHKAESLMQNTLILSDFCGIPVCQK